MLSEGLKGLRLLKFNEKLVFTKGERVNLTVNISFDNLKKQILKMEKDLGIKSEDDMKKINFRFVGDDRYDCYLGFTIYKNFLNFTNEISKENIGFTGSNGLIDIFEAEIRSGDGFSSRESSEICLKINKENIKNYKDFRDKIFATDVLKFKLPEIKILNDFTLDNKSDFTIYDELADKFYIEKPEIKEMGFSFDILDKFVKLKDGKFEIKDLDENSHLTEGELRVKLEKEELRRKQKEEIEAKLDQEAKFRKELLEKVNLSNIELKADKKDNVKLEKTSSLFNIKDTKGLSFEYNSDLENFVCAYVDGNKLSNENYELQSGSTILKLKSEYLKTLSLGEHTLKVEFKENSKFYSGTVDTKFKVVEDKKEEKVTNKVEEEKVIKKIEEQKANDRVEEKKAVKKVQKQDKLPKTSIAGNMIGMFFASSVLAAYVSKKKED